MCVECFPFVAILEADDLLHEAVFRASVAPASSALFLAHVAGPLRDLQDLQAVFTGVARFRDDMAAPWASSPGVVRCMAHARRLVEVWWTILTSWSAGTMAMKKS